MGASPRTLGIREVRLSRRAMLRESDVLPLTELVNAIREEEHLVQEVPHFDPSDGGTRARCLCLLQSPGAKAVCSGFVSRDNPDGTAENFLKLLEDAKIPRAETVLWNIVPWWGGGPIGPSIKRGLHHLARLLRLLPGLEVAVFFGRDAEEASETIAAMYDGIHLLSCKHPSPRLLRPHPEYREQILETLRQAARFLGRA